MTASERENREASDARSQEMEDFLREKEADKPCHRCGNNRFLVPGENVGPFFVTYCSECGFKSEYLVSILTDAKREE